MSEWRLVLILLVIALVATCGQNYKPGKGMVRVPLELPPRPSQEPVEWGEACQTSRAIKCTGKHEEWDYEL